MASADEYAEWIVKNQAKKGTPEFDTVAKAYEEAKAETPQKGWEGSSNQGGPSAAIRMLRNIPGSALRFGKGIAEAVTSPVQTGKAALDAVAGGLRNLTPAPIRNVIDTLDPNPEAAQRATGVADQMGQFYKDRYGGLDNLKKTVVEDPVGAAADLSTVLGVGGALAPGKMGQALNVASKYTNPLSVIPPVVKGTGALAKHTLGMVTGAGAESAAQAFGSGRYVKPEFLANLKGEVPISGIIDEAKHGLENMRLQKSADYRANMASVSGDKTVLSFKGIENAVDNASDMVTYKGQVKNAKAAEAVKDMANEVTKWKLLKPDEFHTPEGLDALKQKLGGILEAIPYEQKTARLAAGKIYNSVKDEIQKQAPAYAKTMEDYTKASEQITEVEKAFSLGNKASQDTAVRKLQSLMRNNVHSNYGNRLDLAKQLESQGGVDLMPSIAGQAMNSWTPRGLVGQAGSYGTGLAALMTQNPVGLGLLPLTSPKAVGLGSYGAGRVFGVGERGAALLGLTPEKARLAGLLGYQLDQER